MIQIAQPTLGQEERDLVLQVLDSGKFAQGEMVAQFEQAFAAYVKADHAVAVMNGTIALYAALDAHGIGPGDLVITTPFSFIATANMIRMVGAKPVFIDIEPETFCLDPIATAHKVRELQASKQTEKRLKAILPVHLYGHPANLDALQRLAVSNNLELIGDACQAHGAKIGETPVGEAGTECWSFYPTKNAMCFGEGGVVTTNDASVAEHLRLLRNHGQRIRYQHDMLGWNFRMTEAQAAVGLGQIHSLPEATRRRRENAQRLTEALADVPGIVTPVQKPKATHVYHQYTIRVTRDFPVSRAELIEALKNVGIGSAIHYPIPIHQQPCYANERNWGSFPVAEQAAAEVLSLPVHPGVSVDEIDFIAQIINQTATARV